ncbi:hypothetical protein BaRGS_00000681 [Batillaria attramentaria]|uniref:Uncharacterized protein n=1 Tax=Batillaria attramentaria TaxID=370345 RepID=A0ABD0M8D6_9CAEN
MCQADKHRHQPHYRRSDGHCRTVWGDVPRTMTHLNRSLSCGLVRYAAYHDTPQLIIVVRFGRYAAYHDTPQLIIVVRFGRYAACHDTPQLIIVWFGRYAAYRDTAQMVTVAVWFG